jgi:hypothetical protein
VVLQTGSIFSVCKWRRRAPSVGADYRRNQGCPDQNWGKGRLGAHSRALEIARWSDRLKCRAECLWLCVLTSGARLETSSQIRPTAHRPPCRLPTGDRHHARHHHGATAFGDEDPVARVGRRIGDHAPRTGRGWRPRAARLGHRRSRRGCLHSAALWATCVGRVTGRGGTA